MKPDPYPPVSLKRRWIVALLLIAIMAVTWGLLARARIPNPLFNGQRESDWIKNLKYLDDNQVAEWRTYGEVGVQVLVRGLQRADHPGQRAYRTYFKLVPTPLRRG